MSDSDLKVQATALQRCLEARVIPVAHAIRWADQYIERTDHPVYEIIAVSMTTSRLEDNVADLLGQVSGTAERGAVLREIFRVMADVLREDPERDKSIAAALFRMAVAEETPSAPASEFMFWIDDALSLAHDRIHGGVEDVRSKLLSFLLEESK